MRRLMAKAALTKYVQHVCNQSAAGPRAADRMDRNRNGWFGRDTPYRYDTVLTWC